MCKKKYRFKKERRILLVARMKQKYAPMNIPYVTKKTHIFPARLLRVKPAMTNIDPVITTQRAQKRPDKELEKGPGGHYQS